MSAPNQNRVSAGVPAGGQFIATERTESQATLTSWADTPVANHPGVAGEHITRGDIEACLASALDERGFDSDDENFDLRAAVASYESRVARGDNRVNGRPAHPDHSYAYVDGAVWDAIQHYYDSDDEDN